MYIQSSSAPDAVRGCDKSLGGGTQQSGAKERGDEEDTTSGEHAEKKENIKNAAEREREGLHEVSA